MKLLQIILPLVGKILCDQQQNQAGNEPDEETKAEKLADTMEQIPKPNFRNLNDSKRKFGKVDWENVYFEDTLDILGSKKARFRNLTLIFYKNSNVKTDFVTVDSQKNQMT